MSAGLGLRALRLKDASRTLHKAVGGVEEAGAITGKGKSQHARCHSPTEPDFLTVHDAARLEAVAPRDGAWPPVTRLLCEMAGGVFLPLPDAEVHDGPVAQGVVRLVKEFGELCAATGEGLADGTLLPEELLRIRREGGEVQAVLAGFLREIDTLIEAQPVSPAQLRLASGQ